MEQRPVPTLDQSIAAVALIAEEAVCNYRPTKVAGTTVFRLS